MAQHIGTVGRSHSNSPVAFLAGSLLAVATMATVIVLAMALGVSVQLRDGATAAQAGAALPAAIDTSRLDPIEQAYIKSTHAGTAAAPRPVFKPYDSSIDAMEQINIDAARTSAGAILGDPSFREDTLPRLQLVPR